jgi:hypothetical protein
MGLLLLAFSPSVGFVVLILSLTGLGILGIIRVLESDILKKAFRSSLAEKVVPPPRDL